MTSSSAPLDEFRAIRRMTNILEAIDLLGNEKSVNLPADVNKAFGQLGAAYGCSEFYPALDSLGKEMLDPVLISAFTRLETDYHQRDFTDQLTRAGLPVVRLIDHRPIAQAFKTANATFRWSWDTVSEKKPSRLLDFLTDKKIGEFEEMSSYLRREWWLKGKTSAFIWNLLTPDKPPTIEEAGILIAVNPRSKVTGIVDTSLTFKNVALRPFITNRMVGRPDRLTDEKRRTIVITSLDRLDCGYDK